MILVIRRPQTDAVLKPDGVAWINVLRGYEVDPSVYPNGGIVLKSVRASGSPDIREHITEPIGTTDRGETITRPKTVIHKRKVISTQIGDDGVTPIYICEPVEYDARYLASLRDDWDVQIYMDETHIPRHIPSGAAKVGPVAENVTENAEPLDLAGLKRESLKAQAKEIRDAGGPDIKLSAGPDRLEAYVKANRQILDTAKATP